MVRNQVQRYNIFSPLSRGTHVFLTYWITARSATNFAYKFAS